MSNMFSSLFSGSRNRKMMIVVAATAALLVVALLSLAIIGIINAVRNNAPEEEEAPAPTNTIPTGFKEVDFTVGLHSGNLILTNDTYAFQGTTPTVNLKDTRPSNPNPDSQHPMYTVHYDNPPLVTQETSDAFQAMMLAFCAQNAGACENIVVDIPNEALYHNGLTVRMRYLVDGAPVPMTPNDTYKWIFENAHLYGFVQMFEAPAEGDTEAVSQEHIFRYVGEVHAQMMKDLKAKNKVTTFESYLAYLRENAANPSKPLSVTINKVTYKVYYLAKDAKQILPEKYESTCVVSGDNMTGYIITYSTATKK